MKKAIFLLLIFTLTFSFVSPNKIEIYAQTEKKVQVVNECILYSEPKTNDEFKIQILYFGEKLTVIGEEVDGVDNGFKFYNVSTEENKTGYVIINFVIDLENNALTKTLDPNAKTLNKSNIFISADGTEKMTLNGEEIVLEQYQEIKIIDGYDKSKKLHQIMFESDGVIYTGYIKTSDLLVDGFNATFIYITFIFVIVGGIVLSIYLTTKKKRKKQAKREL